MSVLDNNETKELLEKSKLLKDNYQVPDIGEVGIAADYYIDKVKLNFPFGNPGIGHRSAQPMPGRICSTS